jgi:hypothetical protein
MSARTGLHQPPTSGKGVIHGRPNMFVWMIVHYASLGLRQISHFFRERKQNT